MIEQVSNAIRFTVFYSSARTGKTGLTVTVDVYNPSGTLIVTAGSATAIGGGLYGYTLASGSVTTEGEYTAIFKTTDTTVDQQHIPAQWTVGRAGVEHLDASINSRLATAGYTAPLNASGVRTALGLAAADLDDQLGAIDAKTANLPSDPSDASDIAGAFSTVNTSLATIAGSIDTEITAIKLKTDLIPASPASTSDIPSASTIAATVRDVENTSPEAGSLGAKINEAAAAAGGGVSPEDIWTHPDRSITDKAGFALGAEGLDAIPITAPTGPATTFRGMVVQSWRRFFKKVEKDASGAEAGALKTYADDGVTVLTSQNYAVTGDDETVGAAT